MRTNLGYLIALYVSTVAAQTAADLRFALRQAFDPKHYGMNVILKNGIQIGESLDGTNLPGRRIYYVDDPLSTVDGYTCLTGSFYVSHALKEAVGNSVRYSVKRVSDELKTAAHFFVSLEHPFPLTLDFTPPYLFFMEDLSIKSPKHSPPDSRMDYPEHEGRIAAYEKRTRWPLLNERNPYRYVRGQEHDHLAYAGIIKGPLEKSITTQEIFEYALAYADRALPKAYFSEADFLDSHDPTLLPTLFRNLVLRIPKEEAAGIDVNGATFSDEEGMFFYTLAKEKKWVLSETFTGSGENLGSIFNKERVKDSKVALGKYILVILYFIHHP